MDHIVIHVDGDKKQAFSSLLHEMQSIAGATIQEVVSYYGKRPIDISNWVAIIILKRVLESTRAGDLLISHGLERDASILLTNQIELRLDMMNISRDPGRAQEWLSHTNEYRKPWKVSKLLSELYGNKAEAESERELYKRFSMVKHGNPVGETLSFPLMIKNGYLTIPPQEDILLGKFALYTCEFCSEIFRTLKAAMICFKRCSLDVTECENKANFIDLMMTGLFNNNIRDQISLTTKTQPKPELCESCGSIPEGRIEMTCLLRRSGTLRDFACDKYTPK